MNNEDKAVCPICRKEHTQEQKLLEQEVARDMAIDAERRMS